MGEVMIRRETLLDALALATLAAGFYAVWCALPGDAMAAAVEAVECPSWLPLAFMLGLVAICAAWALFERISRGTPDDELADEDRAARDLDAIARKAEGAE
jgi:membrane protein implicated in regulation of membrane protease activity